MNLNKFEAKLAEKRAKSGLMGTKTISFTMTDSTITGRTVTGYLAMFNNKDCDGDVLIKGCFAKSLAARGVDSEGGNKIAHLWQHDMREPLGKYTVLKEDDKGLYFECPYDDFEKANRALTQFKSGTLNNFSIGYSYVWDKMEYDENYDDGSGDKGAFICKEINLFEGSVVTLAANDQTYFAGMKSEQKMNELAILKEEAEEAIVGLKSRKQYELRSIITKFIAIAESNLPIDPKEAMRLAALKEQEAKEQKAKDELEQSAQKSKRLSKFSQIVG